MSPSREIAAEPLSQSSFSSFGAVVAVPDGLAASSKGPGWMCWYPLAALSNGTPFQFGLVESTPAARLITSMERHSSRSECVVAVGEPIVQTVALGTAAEQPRVEDARAFVIQPGQAVVIAAGTWHSAAIPLADHASRYIFILPSADGGPPEDWTAFSGGAVLSVVRADSPHIDKGM